MGATPAAQDKVGVKRYHVHQAGGAARTEVLTDIRIRASSFADSIVCALLL